MEYVTIGIEEGDIELTHDEALHLAQQHANEATRLLNEFAVMGKSAWNITPVLHTAAMAHAQSAQAYAAIARGLGKLAGR